MTTPISKIAKARKANIYLRNELAGSLEKIATDEYRFTYTPAWLSEKDFPIGLALPLKKEAYSEESLFPFFDNLIPEGWLLNSLISIYKIDKKNRFALLMATGQETIGAIKVIALNEDGKELRIPHGVGDDKNLTKREILFKAPNDTCPYCLFPLTEKQLEKNQTCHERCARNMWGTTRKIKFVFDSEEPNDSFSDSIKGASVSGAQKKGLFKLEKNELIPSAFGSQYILKPPAERFQNLPENEHLTMAIAKAVGFDVPPFVIFHDEEIGYIFAIKRFDVNDKKIHLRLEDAGQILGHPSDDKYEASYEQLAEAISKFSDAPRPDLVEMWKRVIFCYLTANGDMHLKNWSFLELESLRGVFRLSPCYDFLNTRLVIKKEDRDIGLFLEGKNQNIESKTLMKFASDLGIEKFTKKILEELDSWKSISAKLCQNSFLPEGSKERYMELIEERYTFLISLKNN